MLGTAWGLLADSAVWLLFGLLAAGLLEALLSASRLLALLAGERARSVVWATLLGVPLPLCSCSVLPTALTLRRNGAGRGPTLAFLVATPETSVTSVALTWGLMGPWFAVLRPLAAALSALVAGLAGAAWGSDAGAAAGTASGATAGAAAGASASAASAAGQVVSAAGCCADEHGPACLPGTSQAAPLGTRLRSGLGFAFGDLLDDVFGWILLGVLAAAAVVTWLPPSALTDVPGGALGAMLAMVVVGVPLYVCAEASTPLAAALVAQGLSPGAALVLLLVGPATNLGALGVLAREFGARTVAVYLAAVILVAVGVGLAVDATLGATGALSEMPFSAHASGPGWSGHAAAVVFLVLGCASVLRRRGRRSGGQPALG